MIAHRIIAAAIVAFCCAVVYMAEGDGKYVMAAFSTFEIGVLLFIFRGFEKFERDPYTHHIRLIRGELELAKARRHVRVQTKVI